MRERGPLVGQRARAITYTRQLNAPELAGTLCRPTADPSHPSTRPTAAPRRSPFSRTRIASETARARPNELFSAKPLVHQDLLPR